jgi:predicted AAA+ superfamily ATPase
VARTTVADYLDILEETLLCFRLSGYEARLRVRERKLPKWYWCDPGITRAMKHATGAVVQEERGALFEGLVAQIIRSYKDYRGICDDWHYWAPADSRDTEVDFLLSRSSSIVAIEAKSGTRYMESWSRGLRAAAALKGLKRRIVVYAGKTVLRTEDGIEVLPFERFAELLASDTLWP